MSAPQPHRRPSRHLGIAAAAALPICLCAFLLCLLQLLSPAPAQAAIHAYPEAEQQILYRSRLSLRDNQDQAWQLILFKRLQDGQTIDFKLRLVGFPGQVSLSHPQPAILQQGRDRRWQLSDETDADPQLQSVTATVGQYDIRAAMVDLDRASPLSLTLTLGDREQRSLTLPPYIVREWLNLKDESSDRLP